MPTPNRQTERHAAGRSAPRARRTAGMVLVELVVVFFIMSLLLGLVAIDPIHRIDRNKTDQDLNELYLLLRTVAESAVIKRQAYEVEIGLADGSFAVYRVPPRRPEPPAEGGPAVTEPRPEETALPSGQLLRNTIIQAEFADGTSRSAGELVLRADGQGWTESVLLRITDRDESYPRTIRCDRQTTRVMLSRKELELPRTLKTL